MSMAVTRGDVASTLLDTIKTLLTMQGCEVVRCELVVRTEAGTSLQLEYPERPTIVIRDPSSMMIFKRSEIDDPERPRR